MKIEKKRGWILIEFDPDEVQAGTYRIKFVKYPNRPMCQRTDWTDSGIYWHDENWEWAKWYTNELKQNKEGKNV